MEQRYYGDATISSTGLATAVADGTTNITATLSGVTSTAVNLTVISLSSIDVEPASPDSLVAGSTQQFNAIGTYSNGSTADISSQVTWNSDTTGTATISTTGLATGVAAGTTNITATLSDVTSTVVNFTVISP